MNKYILTQITIIRFLKKSFIFLINRKNILTSLSIFISLFIAIITIYLTAIANDIAQINTNIQFEIDIKLKKNQYNTDYKLSDDGSIDNTDYNYYTSQLKINAGKVKNIYLAELFFDEKCKESLIKNGITIDILKKDCKLIFNEIDEKNINQEIKAEKVVRNTEFYFPMMHKFDYLFTYVVVDGNNNAYTESLRYYGTITNVPYNASYYKNNPDKFYSKKQLLYLIHRAPKFTKERLSKFPYTLSPIEQCYIKYSTTDLISSTNNNKTDCTENAKLLINEDIVNYDFKFIDNYDFLNNYNINDYELIILIHSNIKEYIESFY